MTRHFIVSAAIENSSRLRLVYATPLFEKERNAGLTALPSDRDHPFTPHRPSAKATFPAYDYPVDS